MPLIKETEPTEMYFGEVYVSLQSKAIFLN